MPQESQNDRGCPAETQRLGAITSGLTPAEEAFIRAVLWEEAHLEPGPAHELAHRHHLSIPRLFEPVNRLAPSIQAYAVASLDEPRPAADWPWPGRDGEEVMRDLWNRVCDEQADQAHRVNECDYDG